MTHKGQIPLDSHRGLRAEYLLLGLLYVYQEKRRPRHHCEMRKEMQYNVTLF